MQPTSQECSVCGESFMGSDCIELDAKCPKCSAREFAGLKGYEVIDCPHCQGRGYIYMKKKNIEKIE